MEHDMDSEKEAGIYVEVCTGAICRNLQHRTLGYVRL